MFELLSSMLIYTHRYQGLVKLHKLRSRTPTLLEIGEYIIYKFFNAVYLCHQFDIRLLTNLCSILTESGQRHIDETCLKY